MVMKDAINYPYKWAVGKAAARFISELVNSKRIVGLRCPSCKKVLAPPFDVCGDCFEEISGDDGEWVEVGPCGAVQTFTVVHYKNPLCDLEPPYALVSVRLDGADTDFIHVVKGTCDDLAIGSRVEAVFAEEPAGTLMALESFRLTDKAVDADRPTPVAEFEAKPVYEVKGSLHVPYEWSYGETLTKFFTETRDNKQIMGARCTKCGYVLVPPVGLCGKCFAPTEPDWIPISDHGSLISWTVVYLPFPGQPTEPPYCYGMIRLDGMNTQYPHIIKGAQEKNWDDLEIGMRLEAVWNEDRKGDLYDIAYFKKEGT